MTLPEGFGQGFLALVEKAVATAEQSHRSVKELDELFEVSDRILVLERGRRTRAEQPPAPRRVLRRRGLTAIAPADESFWRPQGAGCVRSA